MSFDEFSDSVIAFKDPWSFIKQAGRFEEWSKVDGDLFTAGFFKNLDSLVEGFLVTCVSKKFKFAFFGNAERPGFGKAGGETVWLFPRGNAGVWFFGIFFDCEMKNVPSVSRI